MRGAGRFVLLGSVYILLGLYFLIFSDYPWFILLFLGLAAYHFFLARALQKFHKEGKGVPGTEKADLMKKKQNP